MNLHASYRKLSSLGESNFYSHITKALFLIIFLLSFLIFDGEVGIKSSTLLDKEEAFLLTLLTKILLFFLFEVKRTKNPRFTF